MRCKLGLGVLLVVVAVLYDIIFKSGGDLVIDIAAVWDNEIAEPARIPSRIVVG